MSVRQGTLAVAADAIQWHQIGYAVPADSAAVRVLRASPATAPMLLSGTAFSQTAPDLGSTRIPPGPTWMRNRAHRLVPLSRWTRSVSVLGRPESFRRAATRVQGLRPLYPSLHRAGLHCLSRRQWHLLQSPCGISSQSKIPVAIQREGPGRVSAQGSFFVHPSAGHWSRHWCRSSDTPLRFAPSVTRKP